MSRRPRLTVVPAMVLSVLALQGLALSAPASATAAEATTAASADAATDAAPDPDDASIGLAYPGNMTTESVLVAEEEERLSHVRTTASMVRWRGLDLSEPYRLATGSTYTLMLTKRDEPYGIADLLSLAPQTFVREPDGAYVLTENIAVQPGATLDLSAAGSLTIRMASDEARFVSIVNMGGELITRGTKKHPVTVTSWDRDAGAPDTATDDGRAYIRSIGGRVDLRGTTFSNLGFWSGRTGGVALTGSDLPTEGTLDQYGRELRDAVAANSTTAAAPPTAEQRRAAEDAAEAGTVVEEAPTTANVEGLLPAGVLPVQETDKDNPSFSYVSAQIENSTFDGNAFGLFISGANGVDISGATIQNSLIDGLVMHRFVINAAINDTVSQQNAGDGIILARATTGIMITEVRSLENGGSGVVLRGAPLADGPSATGMPVGDYGNNSIANSVSSGNGRYGIEVVGGENITVNANDVEGNDMGIVVRDAASDVTMVGNRLTDNVRHGIALRDGVTSAVISGNVIAGGPDGIYLRDSSAVVQRNTLSGLTNHAITVVGGAAGTVVEENMFAGRGPSAIDRKRSEGASVGENDSSSWESTKPFWTTVRNAFQPLTVLWIALGLLVVGTAVKGSRHRDRGQAPYAAQKRMSELVDGPIVAKFLSPNGRHSNDDRLVRTGVGGPESGADPRPESVSS